MDHSQLDAAVKEWLRLDLNPTTRKEVEQLAASQNHEELSKMFSKRISFGTAGLRAEMRAGIAFMNELVIIQSTQGLVQYVLKTVNLAKEKGIVIGYDHRLQSKRFAELAAIVGESAGMIIYLYKGFVHTPMVPFGVKRLKAAAGIMITASHNPAKDNGYKVYFENAVQIIEPHASGIAQSINDNLEVLPAAFGEYNSIDEWSGTDSMNVEYIKSTRSVCPDTSGNSKTKLLFTFTAMHGVGLKPVEAIMNEFEFSQKNLSIVPLQAQPDPLFPTVKFPNPEEKGALNLAIEHANSTGSTIILANDPDADRFCAAEKDSSTRKWKIFTGDELGTIFGYFNFQNYKSSGKALDKLAMAVTTVSSKMLAEIGRREGFFLRETLTGFKYLGNEALKLEEEGFEVIFAYEEAIGYMNGTEIRDKDGVTALALFCSLAVKLEKEGKTITSYLESIYEQYGFFTTSNAYFISRDLKITDEIFNQLRYGSKDSKTLNFPKTLAGFSVTYIRDLTIGYDSSTTDNVPDLPIDRTTHMISFRLDDKEVTVTGTVRTSGTEPKIKFYLEGNGFDRTAVIQKLALVREAIGTEWLKVKEFGLIE